MRVLIVEDDPLQADVLFHAFQKPGYTVTHENNGKRADHLLTAHEFDVVILDMGLPELDGAEILRRLRQENWISQPERISMQNKSFVCYVTLMSRGY